MKNMEFSVSNECIGCRACVALANDNFEMDKNSKAYVKKQPETEKEKEKCTQAMNACPVNAISTEDGNKAQSVQVVLASSNIKETLDRYPKLKNILIDLSPKFKKLQNPVSYNTLARFADFNDAAKITGLSICEILHTINKYLGVEDKLLKIMPECIEEKENIEQKSVDIVWRESEERYIYNNDVIEELAHKISKLEPQKNIVIIGIEKPIELLKVADGLGFLFNIEKNREYRVSIFNPQKEINSIPWQNRKEDFDLLDVRWAESDPFDTIIKKAYDTKDDDGFILVQRFMPMPIMNMLLEMGFEYVSEKKSDEEFWIYFHKKPEKQEKIQLNSKKTDIVVQSATPVAYPVIMRLLQSEKIRDTFNIKELKVWDETEKHLAWITNGKADISFSALITSAKLKSSDIKIPALFVWDNFVLLSRRKAKDFGDVKSSKIRVPLFEEAPPAKITKYLIKASGFKVDDFTFVYGKPFGRPEEIYKDFVDYKSDTVVLREPEASYAIKIMQDRGEKISVISYNEVWNKINPGFGSFPNAGVVLKGEFTKRYPQQTRLFLDELKSSIDWVNSNKKEAARLSFDLMGQSVDKIELFLNRVNFEYVEGKKLTEKVKQYFDILTKNGLVDVEIDSKFFNIFEKL